MDILIRLLIPTLLVVALFWLPIFVGLIYGWLKNITHVGRFSFFCGVMTHGVLAVFMPFFVTPIYVIKEMVTTEFCFNEEGRNVCLVITILDDWSIFIGFFFLGCMSLISPILVRRASKYMSAWY